MKTYKSKFGYTVVIFTCLVCLYPIFSGYTQGSTFLEKPFPIGVLLFCIVLVLYLNFDTQYTIQDSQLKVRCGFLYQRTFDVNSFTSVKRTNNLISSPAPSLQRLEIKYGNYGSLIISPENEKQFAADLVRINPTIHNSL
ncbi:PH domain-containing protein [Sediminicola luteus]|uniref:PH domain-containing protein n=1 Tax=Sediminicola luteus TaxID=319238 RepID=UPI0015547955|nr:PH domain-containing protein [Sediminicola luteus]